MPLLADKKCVNASHSQVPLLAPLLRPLRQHLPYAARGDAAGASAEPRPQHPLPLPGQLRPATLVLPAPPQLLGPLEREPPLPRLLLQLRAKPVQLRPRGRPPRGLGPAHDPRSGRARCRVGFQHRQEVIWTFVLEWEVSGASALCLLRCNFQPG